MVEALQADKNNGFNQSERCDRVVARAISSRNWNTQGLAKAIEYALQSEAQNDFSPLYAKAKAELTVPTMAEQTLNIYKGLLKT